MSMPLDIRAYIVSKNSYFVPYEQAGGFVSIMLMPGNNNGPTGKSSSYMIALVPEAGKPIQLPKTKIKGLYVLIRARRDEIEQQEADDDAICDILHLSGPIPNGSGLNYMTVEADTSGAEQLGWEGEDANMVRYTAHHYSVWIDK